MNTPIVLDHDIGTNPDDFFELLLLISKARPHLKLLISGNRFPKERAQVAAGILQDFGMNPLLSFAGEETGCVDFYGQSLIEEGLPTPPTNYLEAIYRLTQQNEKVIYLCTQGLSNLARFTHEHPEQTGKLKIYHMGMNIRGFEDWIKGGTNMEADPLAAKHIYSSHLDLTVIGGHTTLNDSLRVIPSTRLYQILHKKQLPAFKKLTGHLADFATRRGLYPCMHDPLVAAVALGETFCTFKDVQVEFNDSGLYRQGGNTSVRISNPESKAAEFMEYMAQAFESLS